MSNTHEDKVIEIREDHVVIRTGRFTFKSAVTPERDINGCVASCVEKVTNSGLTGIQIKDYRAR